MSVVLHCHNHYEIAIVTEGKILNIINGKRQSTAQGDMVLLRPEDRHSIESLPGFSSQAIYLGITPEKLNSICAIVPDFAALFLDETAQFQIALFDNELEYFLSNAHQVSLLKDKDSEAFKNFTAVITSEMIFEALAIFYKRNINTNANYPAWFNDLLQKMHAPEALGYQIQDIYALSNYSPPMLLKYFNEYLGETIVSYFTKIKIRFACNLLRSTNFTILDIASRISYDSISHFNKVFKEHTGKTPSEYRKTATRI
ncbi:MAG: AraC family transcriptional regulator [Clostridiales bacterium]|nr:AraC family transcriptional regulator [Clostridiales bacterium]